MAEPFLGQITLFGFNFAPVGWAQCTGQILPLQQYTALFSLLGTQFGGDGRSNFGLPDLQGRVAVGQGQGPGLSNYLMGEESGSETVSVTVTSMPAHTHSLNATTNAGTANAPAGDLLAKAVGGPPREPDKGFIYGPGPASTGLVPGSIGLAGGNQPHNNLQPLLALNYCIALVGVYPQRS